MRVSGQRISRHGLRGMRPRRSRPCSPARLVLLAGCKPVGPNYTRPGYQAPAAYKETGALGGCVRRPIPPEALAAGQPSDGMLRGKWWEIYQDPQLNQLEDRIADEQSRVCARRWRPILPRATR